MSHTVKILSQFKNLNALQKGFQKLGWQLKENTMLRSYRDQDNRVYSRAAINPEKRKCAFDVGIEENNGVFELFYDPFGGSIENTLGVGCSCLKVATKRIEIEQYAEDNGYECQVKELANGGLQIEIAQ